MSDKHMQDFSRATQGKEQTKQLDIPFDKSSEPKPLGSEKLDAGDTREPHIPSESQPGASTGTQSNKQTQ